MNDQILEAIKKKAQSSAGLFSTHAQQEFYARAYTSGCIEGIELMKGFADWAAANGYKVGYDGKIAYWSKGDYAPDYTTEQLLSEYIKTLNNG